MMRRTCFMLVASAAVLGCDSATGPVVGASEGRVLASQADVERTIKSDGAGFAQLPPGFGQAEFAFEAKENAAGKVQGSFRMYRVRNGLTSDFAGEVTCMAVDPVANRAWIGAVVTENNSTDPNQQQAIHQPGQDVWFRVLDNGGTDPALPDRITILGFKSSTVATSAQYCTEKAWAAGNANTFPVVVGDLRVKPKH